MKTPIYDKAVIDNIHNVRFTHLWVDDFGWENTIYQIEDFAEIEVFGMDNEVGILLFFGIFDNGKKRLLKGNIQ